MKSLSLFTVLISTSLLLLASVPQASGYYDPGIQRWINRDPVGIRGGINQFAYVRNQVTVLIDKFGLCDLSGNPKPGIGYGPNCYTYAINNPSLDAPNMPDFPEDTVPSQFLSSTFTCLFWKLAIIQPVGAMPPGNDGCCRTGYHKISLHLASNGDFHVYRQDNDGNWSHKPGDEFLPSRCDASEHVILNPDVADHDYSHQSSFNYNVNCGILCVPTKYPLTPLAY